MRDPQLVFCQFPHSVIFPDYTNTKQSRFWVPKNWYQISFLNNNPPQQPKTDNRHFIYPAFDRLDKLWRLVVYINTELYCFSNCVDRFVKPARVNMKSTYWQETFQIFVEGNENMRLSVCSTVTHYFFSRSTALQIYS